MYYRLCIEKKSGEIEKIVLGDAKSLSYDHAVRKASMTAREKNIPSEKWYLTYNNEFKYGYHEQYLKHAPIKTKKNERYAGLKFFLQNIFYALKTERIFRINLF